jgi:hypothetical protein
MTTYMLRFVAWPLLFEGVPKVRSFRVQSRGVDTASGLSMANLIGLYAMIRYPTAFRPRSRSQPCLTQDDHIRGRVSVRFLDYLGECLHVNFASEADTFLESGLLDHTSKCNSDSLWPRPQIPSSQSSSQTSLPVANSHFPLFRSTNTIVYDLLGPSKVLFASQEPDVGDKRPRAASSTVEQVSKVARREPGDN